MKLATAFGVAALLVIVPHARGTGAQVPLDGDIVISIPDVPGPYCVYGIEKRVRDLRGVDRVELLWREEQIRIVLTPQSTVTTSDVQTAVERAEYPYPFTIEP